MWHTAVEGCENLKLVSQQCLYLEACVSRAYPWLGRMEVDALYSLRAGKELSLYVKMRVSRVHGSRVECWLDVLTFTSRRILATGPAYARGVVLSVPASSSLLSRFVPDNCEVTIRVNDEIQFNLDAGDSWSCKLVHSLTPPSSTDHQPLLSVSGLRLLLEACLHSSHHFIEQ